MLFTTSERIKKTDDYKKIVGVLERMNLTGVIWMAQGQCISMSDVLCTSLIQVGIKCRMIECQLSIMDNNTNPPNHTLVGFDGYLGPGQIDTHVVCVTDTEIPMIIDASISHMLPNDKKIIVDELQSLQNRIFCNVEKQNIKLTYQQKTNNKILFEHQKSILDRIQTDKKIFNSISVLKYLIILALCISTLNAGRGFYDFYSRYVDDNKLVGVSANQEIIDRLIVLENKLKNR
jgi:hypothetical protein